MATVDTTVITPSIPSRAEPLQDAMRWVQAQTVQPQAHIIRVQQPPTGMPVPVHTAHQRNQLAAAVETEWCSTLDDDDIYRPNHFAAIEQALRSHADVIYTYASQPSVARVDTTEWPRDRLVHRLERANDCIPSNAAIRTTTLREIGGWDETTYTDGRYASGATHEDWDLWLRLAQAGAWFLCVPAVTWEYGNDRQ